LAAALAHTPEAEEALRGARTRMARKPPALARELLRNFPKRRARNARRRRKGSKGAGDGAGAPNGSSGPNGARSDAAGNSNEPRYARGVTSEAGATDDAKGGANGARGGAGAAGNSPRTPRTGKNRRRRAKSQTPSDAVLTEALSSAPVGAEGNGGVLAPGAGEKLQRNVDEALEHAQE
jgi:hypothetical protein